jgi:3-phenylpropionate/trans-cinnamate dioxygenase ferredoxin reductase component
VADTYVIVGAGLAGAKAAETLRAEGFDGRVVLVGREPELPYERPPLSKSYLVRQSPFEEAQVHDEAWYEAQSVDLLRGTEIMELRPGEHTVVLADGEELRYDRLLLATGALPRRPPIPGADRDGVLTLRTVGDSDALHAAAERGGGLAIVGAGWIGCEVAASARTLGAEVTLIEQVQRPLERVLGPQLGDFFAEVHREEGVELRMGVGVQEIADGRVVLSGGEEVRADAVLIATGVAPDTRLAEAAGLDVDNGVVVDEHLRTSAPDVWAAGDIARAPYARWGGRRMRVEHWANAIDQGTAAAKAMLGRDSEEPLPYFFTDQYDVGMEYAGVHGEGDTPRIDGELERAGFEVLWTDGDGRVTAGMHVNRWDAMERIRGLVSDRARL